MTLCFFICACIVSSNANAGFNVVLTAIIYVAYVGLLAATFNKKRTVSFISVLEYLLWGSRSMSHTGTLVVARCFHVFAFILVVVVVVTMCVVSLCRCRCRGG